MVYVGNLPPGVEEDSLRAACIPFGEINQIVMPPKPTSQTGVASEIAIARNFALVEFEDVEDGEHAVFNLNDSEFFGKVIAVHWAKNSQKQALLGKSKAIWHQQQSKHNAEDGGAADMVIVDNKPLEKQGLVPI